MFERQHGLISRAADEVWSARSIHLSAQERLERRRLALRAVDAVLEALECANLGRAGVSESVLIARCAERLRTVGLTPPPQVVVAQAIAPLHDALLDWEEDLLTMRAPGRCMLNADADADADAA